MNISETVQSIFSVFIFLFFFWLSLLFLGLTGIPGGIYIESLGGAIFLGILLLIPLLSYYDTLNRIFKVNKINLGVFATLFLLIFLFFFLLMVFGEGKKFGSDYAYIGYFFMGVIISLFFLFNLKFKWINQ